MDRLYDTYQIPQEALCVFAPSPHIRASDLILVEDTTIVF